MGLFDFLERRKRRAANAQVPDRQPHEYAHLAAKFSRENNPMTNITGTGRDYSGLADGKRVKIWVPDIVKTAVKELSNSLSANHSDLLRQIFFSHHFGRYDMHYLREKRSYLLGFAEKMNFRLSDDAGASRTPELGKNSADFTLQMPQMILDEMKRLAEHYDLSLSEYSREVLVMELFGRAYLSERQLVSDVKFVEDEE